MKRTSLPLLRRRELITLFGGAVAAWPLAARTQQAAMPMIGYLSGATFETMREYVAAFHRGLADAGFAEGRNVAIEYRWAEGHNDRLPALAMDLVRRGVAVIVVGSSTPGTLAAKAATQTIPIVFQIGTDPVKVGLVPSLARPGGNITGITIINVELIAKCLELMHNLMRGPKILPGQHHLVQVAPVGSEPLSNFDSTKVTKKAIEADCQGPSRPQAPRRERVASVARASIGRVRASNERLEFYFRLLPSGYLLNQSSVRCQASLAAASS
jgi:hypothetical protein